MRKFRLNTLLDNDHTQNYKIMYLIPSIGQKYIIDEVEFRCIEHRKGKVLLKNDNTTIELIEINS